MFNNNKFKVLRKKANMLQSDVAFKLGVGTSTVGMWELGNSHPNDEMIVKIANLFNVTTDYLLDVPTRTPEQLPAFDETLDKDTAVKLVKEYIMSQSDWSDERKQMNLKQIDLMFGDDK